MQTLLYMLEISGNLPIATPRKNLGGLMTLSDPEGQSYSIKRRVVESGGTNVSKHCLSSAYNVRTFTEIEHDVRGFALTSRRKGDF